MLIGSKPVGTVAYLGGLPAVLEGFCWSFAQLVAFSSEAVCGSRQHLHLEKTTYSDHGPARNELTGKFLGDWLLMLDTDHVFEPDLLYRLLSTMRAVEGDVITGLYRFKGPPHAPVLFHWHGEQLRPIVNWPAELAVLEIGSAGAGCLLVKRKVFERIRKELREEPFDRMPGLSEDHSFFHRLKKLDIKAYCDVRVEYGHMKLETVKAEHQDLEGFTVSDPIPVRGFK